MPDLSFKMESASVVPFAAVPMLAFQLQIKNASADEKNSHHRPALPDSD